MIRLCALSFQAQSQGSITLKIIPATQEEDRLKDSKVWGSWRQRRGGQAGAADSSPAFETVIREEIIHLVLGTSSQ